MRHAVGRGEIIFRTQKTSYATTTGAGVIGTPASASCSVCVKRSESRVGEGDIVAGRGGACGRSSMPLVAPAGRLRLPTGLIGWSGCGGLGGGMAFPG